MNLLADSLGVRCDYCHVQVARRQAAEDQSARDDADGDRFERGVVEGRATHYVLHLPSWLNEACADAAVAAARRQRRNSRSAAVRGARLEPGESKSSWPAQAAIVGVERIPDGEGYVAAATLDATTTRTLYFDVVSGLLRREMTQTETMLLPLQEQIDYDDYRDVSGVQLPFRVRTSEGAPYGNVTRTFLQIRRNVAIDDAQFRPPSAPR
jgi:hypothetical protein